MISIRARRPVTFCTLVAAATLWTVTLVGFHSVALAETSEADSDSVHMPTDPVVELVPPVGPVIGEATVMALACDDDIREIGFWVDGRFAGADDSPPFELTADFGTDIGPHTVRALAVDRHRVVVGQTSIEVNNAEARLEAALRRQDGRIRLTAGAPPGFRTPVGYQVFAGSRQLAALDEPDLELTVATDDLLGENVLRLAAEYEDGSRIDRYLVVDKGFTESVDVNEVQLWVTITDRKGDPVLDLDPDAFSIEIEGVSDADGPTILRPAEEPLTLAVVLDGSDSMAGLRKTLRTSTEKLATEMLREDDRLLLFSVADRPQLLNPGGDPIEAVETLEEWSNGGGSALYDSLYFAIRRLGKMPGRKALVLISDGADLHSHIDTDRVADAAWLAGIPVFLITGPMPHDALSRMRAYNLHRFAEATGGRVLGGGSVRAQDRALEKILQLVRHPYVLPLSAGADLDLADLRELEIRLGDPKLEARVFLGGDSG